MPVLENARHERFAQLVAAGVVATTAYEKAGYDKASSNAAAASRLLKKVKVKERIRELQAESALKHEITRDKITAMLIADREFARLVGQAGAARAASESLGRLHGLYIEKREDAVTLHDISDKPMTAEDWEEEYARSPNGVAPTGRPPESSH